MRRPANVKQRGEADLVEARELPIREGLQHPTRRHTCAGRLLSEGASQFATARRPQKRAAKSCEFCGRLHVNSADIQQAHLAHGQAQTSRAGDCDPAASSLCHCERAARVLRRQRRPVAETGSDTEASMTTRGALAGLMLLFLTQCNDPGISVGERQLANFVPGRKVICNFGKAHTCVAAAESRYDIAIAVCHKLYWLKRIFDNPRLAQCELDAKNVLDDEIALCESMECPSGSYCTDRNYCCHDDQQACRGDCIDDSYFQSSTSDCGSCNAACAAGQFCCDGACTSTADGSNCSPCPSGQTYCTVASGGNYCASTGSDPQNCGGCGVRCGGASPYCVGGSCSPCPEGQTQCSSQGGAPTCVDLSTDANNCGACGKSCGGGSGKDCCGGSCVNSLIDSKNCGECGHACASGLSCDSGVCDSCPSGVVGDGACVSCSCPAGQSCCVSLSCDRLSTEFACVTAGGACPPPPCCGSCPQ